MRNANTGFPTFVHPMELRLGGMFVCDHNQLDKYFGGKSYGMDLLDFLGSNDKAIDIYTEGLGIAIPFRDSDLVTVVFRHSLGPAYLKTPPKIISRGWILFAETGKLVLSEFGSLMFYDPLEDEEDRFTFVEVPTGWYIVEVAWFLAESKWFGTGTVQ